MLPSSRCSTPHQTHTEPLPGGDAGWSPGGHVRRDSGRERQARERSLCPYCAWSRGVETDHRKGRLAMQQAGCWPLGPALTARGAGAAFLFWRLGSGLHVVRRERWAVVQQVADEASEVTGDEPVGGRGKLVGDHHRCSAVIVRSMSVNRDLSTSNDGTRARNHTSRTSVWTPLNRTTCRRFRMWGPSSRSARPVSSWNSPRVRRSMSVLLAMRLLVARQRDVGLHPRRHVVPAPFVNRGRDSTPPSSSSSSSPPRASTGHAARRAEER
jgi:hypothetical protein